MTDQSSSLALPDWNRLTAIGCRALGDSAMIGAIGLPITADSLARYDCGTIPADSIINAIQTILSDAAAADGMTTAMVYGYWWLIDVTTDCTNGGTGEPAHWEGSQWVLTELIAPSCTKTYTYQWEAESGGGPTDPPDVPSGGGGGGGDGGDEGGSAPPSTSPVTKSDVFVALHPPDCAVVQTEEANRAWCAGVRPRTVPALMAVIDPALARLRALGGILFHTMMLQNYYDESHAGRFGSQPATLQLILSHEVDHLMGVRGHVDAQNVLTTHATECSEYGPD